MFTVFREKYEEKRRLAATGVVCAIHELKELTDDHPFFYLY